LVVALNFDIIILCDIGVSSLSDYDIGISSVRLLGVCAKEIRCENLADATWKRDIDRENDTNDDTLLLSYCVTTRAVPVIIS